MAGHRLYSSGSFRRYGGLYKARNLHPLQSVVVQRFGEGFDMSHVLLVSTLLNLTSKRRQRLERFPQNPRLGEKKTDIYKSQRLVHARSFLFWSRVYVKMNFNQFAVILATACFEHYEQELGLPVHHTVVLWATTSVCLSLFLSFFLQCPL